MSVDYQMSIKGLKSMLVEKSKYLPEIENPAESDTTYPYGLKITLDKEVLKVLNIQASDLKVGDDLTLDCRACVIGLTSSTGRHDSSESVELQITHLGMEEQEKSNGN